MSEVVTVQKELRLLAGSAHFMGNQRVLNFAADCLDAEAAKITRLEDELAAITALHASAIAAGLAMATQIEAIASRLLRLRESEHANRAS